MRNKRHIFVYSMALFFLAGGLQTHAAIAKNKSVQIAVGYSTITLNGPWRFHIGDNPRWSSSDFDDSEWETVNLTAPPGAHDSDVGLTGYVSGWDARGHTGYWGYAWYRLRLSIAGPQEDKLALLGPPDVDTSYQVFLNGRLLGGEGNFSHMPPLAYSIQPKVFPLPHTLINGGAVLLAFRVWMGPWYAGVPYAGGIHIAPVLGENHGIGALYRLQWLETVKGYIVEIIEALLFCLLAMMACSLIPFDRSDRAYLWLSAALLLTALQRANQALFFWWQFETIHEFELFIIVFVIPLSLAAWTLAWRAWFRPPQTPWMIPVVVLLTAEYVIAEFFSRSWFHGTFSHPVTTAFHDLILGVRMAFLLLLILIVFLGIKHHSRQGWYALPAVLLISVGQFAPELSALHVPGIWFPFGTGVSRTQFAYSAFIVTCGALFLHRLWSFAAKPGAIRTLLQVTDFKTFLKESGYPENTPACAPEKPATDNPENRYAP